MVVIVASREKNVFRSGVGVTARQKNFADQNLDDLWKQDKERSKKLDENKTGVQNVWNVKTDLPLKTGKKTMW